MTLAEATATVWAHFPRRSRKAWTLVVRTHHSGTPAAPVFAWWLEGCSTTQDRYERNGFVDAAGVEVLP